MGKSLVIVESPAKAKTISRFLGRNYTVKASVGHVRDLPKSQLGVDVENGFQPRYITIRGKGPVLKELRDAAKKADRILFATDPDRRGSDLLHLADALKVDGKAHAGLSLTRSRTGGQVCHKAAPSYQSRLGDAQQARRVLDRLVGYKLSPLLWAKVRRASAPGVSNR